MEAVVIDDRCIKHIVLAYELQVPVWTVVHITTKKLRISKISFKWVPEILAPDLSDLKVTLKTNTIHTTLYFLEWLTGGETWIWKPTDDCDMETQGIANTTKISCPEIRLKYHGQC
jgi:hypothetical protein